LETVKIMTAIILHLSDIHIQSSLDPILSKSQEIASSTFSLLPLATHVFIVVSGDVAFSGKAEQYELASIFFNKIKGAINKETSAPVTFIVAPGNHDCDFGLDSGTRKILIKSIDGNELESIDASVIETCTAIQTPFFQFREQLENNTDAADDRLWRSSKFHVDGKILGFECLNISWVSKIEEEVGQLFFPVDRYTDKKDDNVDIRLVVIHHPLNWFSQTMYRKFRKFVRNLANVVISGHEHQGNVGVVHDAEAEESAFVEGCVLQEAKNLHDSSFNIIAIDLEKSQFSSTQYAWNGKLYATVDEGSWSDYHHLPAKQSSLFPLRPDFQEVLDDPGAFLKHPAGVNVTLSDIYVYPDLMKVNNVRDKARGYISSRRLNAPEVTADGVLIEGDEKAGCSSLLFKLYRQYHDRGFVPLLIKGKDLRRDTSAEIEVCIRHAVEAQYGKSLLVQFNNTPSSQKVLLLDDFDEGPMRAASARAGLLCELRKRFKHIVVSVSEMFEMSEMLDGDASRQLMSLEHYKIQPFNYTLRSELIERWYSLGNDGTVDEAKFIAQCDQAERLMDVVMTKMVIPPLPLYLLTLLQSMEAGRSGDFKDSSLGYYYQYLLVEAFQQSGVKADKLTEQFQYVSHLAWEFHCKNKHELSEIELRSFNNRFCANWHTVDFGTRLELLIEAKVLCRKGEEFSFRYPYIYYYLKGMYLSDELSDLDIRAYIEHCCKHLYVRDYANTVLFLAHHTNDDFVISNIAGSLHGLFGDRKPVSFEGDTGSVTMLINDAPKLIYSGESPSEHRKKRNEIKDRIDDGADGLAELEEESVDLSLIAKMTMLFKTTEILGQVLKNQYSRIKRGRKAELLGDMFNGPLRALRYFYDFFEENPEGLAAEIEAAMERKGGVEQEDDRKKLAKNVVSGVIQLVTFGFVMRAVQAASSESLAEDVSGLVEREGTSALRLIEIGIDLDSPKPLPRSKLKHLYKEVEKDVLAARLLRLMVLNRLYMFKTSEQDMQWLNSELKIDLETQHRITYQEGKRRLVR